MFVQRLKIAFILFIFYSFVGWVLEVIDQLMRQKKIINRGFLIGPYCPVHGVGALLMLMSLSGFSDSILVLFLSAVIICSCVEYLTGFLLEKIFKARWWDYSDCICNLNGRICLQYSLFFGLAGVVIVKFANPLVMKTILSINPTVLNIFAIVTSIIFIADLCISFKVIYNFKNLTNKLTKDNTEEISNRVKNTLSKKSIWFKRLVNAFPTLGRGVKKIGTNIISIVIK